MIDMDQRDVLMQYPYFAVKYSNFFGKLRCFYRNFCIFATVNIKFIVSLYAILTLKDIL